MQKWNGRAREKMVRKMDIDVIAIGDESMHGMDMSTTVEEKPENTKVAI